MSNCICNFIKRTFLYQILIIIASLKLKNAFRYNKEFYNRISDFITSINLPEKLLKYLPKNREYTHKGFLISLIVIASFSILGLNFFKILSGIGCILLAFLYHNPIPKFKLLLQKNEPFSWALFEQNLPEMEFILYIALAFAMFANAFCGKCEKKGEEKKDKQNEIILEQKITENPPEQPKNKKKKINLNIKCKNSNSLDIFYKFKKIKASPNKEYMLTPCKHIFHRDCLEKWFLHKKECPNCRNNLSDII